MHLNSSVERNSSLTISKNCARNFSRTLSLSFTNLHGEFALSLLCFSISSIKNQSGPCAVRNDDVPSQMLSRDLTSAGDSHRPQLTVTRLSIMEFWYPWSRRFIYEPWNFHDCRVAIEAVLATLILLKRSRQLLILGLLRRKVNPDRPSGYPPACWSCWPPTQWASYLSGAR